MKRLIISIFFFLVVYLILSASNINAQPTCPSGRECRNYATTALCVSAGGIAQACVGPPGVSSGNCCVPQSLPPQCPSNGSCQYYSTPDLCQGAGGNPVACSTPTGEVGNCCTPSACARNGGTCAINCPTNSDTIGIIDCPKVPSGSTQIQQICCVPYCQNGYYCDIVSDPYFCSDKRGGIWKSCYVIGGGLGNCCVPQLRNALPCPSNEMPCNELDYTGICVSPCIRVVTRQGSPRGGVAMCQCQEIANPPGSVACGGRCQRPQDCKTPCAYCWGGFGQVPVCQQKSFSDTIRGMPDLVKMPVFCDTRGNKTTDPNLTGKIYTALGCIPTYSESEFTKYLLQWGMGIAGGIAFLFIIYSGFLIITSGGNPQRLSAGKELLTAAIMGLSLLILSVFILRFIGIDLFKIPGLV